MRPDLDETHSLARRRDTIGVALQIDIGDASRAPVAENELPQRRASVPDHFGETLLGNGENSAVPLAGASRIEDAELDSADVSLNDGRCTGSRKIACDVVRRARDHDARAALAD